MLLPSKDLRVSDAERESVAEFLKGHYTAGRLTEDELSERVDAAYRARRTSQLLALIRDLPRTDLAGPAPRRGLPLRPILAVFAALLAMAMLVDAMPGELALVFFAVTVPMLLVLALMLTPLALGALALVWVVRAVRGPGRARYPVPAPRRQRWLA